MLQMSRDTGGFNRWMQHTESCHGSRSVADAPEEADLLLGDTEVVDVGSLAARRVAATGCRPIRSTPFRYRRGPGAIRRHSSTPTAPLTTGVATGRTRGNIAWCGGRKGDSFDCRCAEPGALNHQPRAPKASPVTPKVLRAGNRPSKKLRYTALNRSQFDMSESIAVHLTRLLME
jgi:hypothetical protein